VAGEIEFPPVGNGLDYLDSAVTHLHDAPTPRDLKYAVLHLHSAVEVLLKARLMREDWSLIFADPGKATHAAFTTGDFGSIGVKETLTRLRERADVELSEKAQESFKRLTGVRNKLQHFGLKEQALAVEKLVGEVLDALLVFIGQHLEPGAKPEEEEPLREARELIWKETARIRMLVDARTRRITPELEEKSAYIVTCPDCLQLTLELGEEGEAGRCLLCYRTWHDPEETAGDYAWSVLHRSSYEAIKGGDKPPVRTCPACDWEALVDDVMVRVDEDIPRWVCFNCMVIVLPDGIDDCAICGEPILVDEDSSTVCDNCFDYAMGRD
jgi:hypothetical protein